MEENIIDTIELGNLLFGHSRGNYSVDREAFDKRFYDVLVEAGYDNYGCPDRDEVSPCFIVRSYWWGDEDAEEARLPNFECKALGLEIRWYKYPLRDSYSNIPFTEDVMKELESMVGIK